MTLFADISTVTVAAVSRDMTTVDAVKAELQITGNGSDAQLLTLIHQASAAIVSYCGREFARETVADTFRPGRCWGAAGDSLMLKRWPVTSIVSILEDAAGLAAADYELNGDTGELWRLDANGVRQGWAATPVVVTYVAGYEMVTDLPFDLERACLDLVKLRWFATRRDPLVKGESVPGVYDVQYWVGSIGDDGALPPSVTGAIDRYRTMAV